MEERERERKRGREKERESKIIPRSGHNNKAMMKYGVQYEENTVRTIK